MVLALGTRKIFVMMIILVLNKSVLVLEVLLLVNLDQLTVLVEINVYLLYAKEMQRIHTMDA
jgi:hypothetical protein